MTCDTFTCAYRALVFENIVFLQRLKVLQASHLNLSNLKTLDIQAKVFFQHAKFHVRHGKLILVDVFAARFPQSTTANVTTKPGANLKRDLDRGDAWQVRSRLVGVAFLVFAFVFVWFFFSAACALRLTSFGPIIWRLRLPCRARP